MSMDELQLLRHQIKLQRELDTLRRQHDASMATYNMEYRRAQDGLRMKWVPSGIFKTIQLYENRSRLSGSMGETWRETYQVNVGSERVEQQKQVPDYPGKPEVPQRIYQIQKEIQEIDKKLDGKA